MIKITFKKLVASIFMILAATLVVNAQTDQTNPWHVVVDDANGNEVASHSIEIITDVTVSADASEVDFLLDNGTTYSYPITSTFYFEQRAGNGTAIETIAAPMWNVSYTGGALHFTQQVDNVAIYAISGVLIKKFNENSTSIPVSLIEGLYIVQADGKAVKLLVNSNGNGGTSQPVTVSSTVSQSTNTVQQSTSPTFNTQTFRAATATLKTYWNINAGNTITSIDIGSVNTFHITTDNVIVFSMKDGNTVELTNYQSTSFGAQPTASQNTDWDMARTILYGGATYAWGYSNPPAITFAAVHKNGLAFHSVIIDNTFIEDKRIINSDIDPKLWDAGNNPYSRLSASFGYMYTGYGMSYPETGTDSGWISLMTSTGVLGEYRASDFSFNNNVYIILTTFVKDGSKITMTCVDINGKTWSYTFSAW